MGVKRPVTRGARREQATRTRRRILDVAYGLFCSAGYEATTMQRVADEAGVAVQTVYFTFGTKARLLAEVESLAILGSAPSDQWRAQPWAARMQTETDPTKLLALFVDVDSEIKARISGFVAAVGPALASDPETVARRDQSRDMFFGNVVDRLQALKALREGLTRERALDIIRVINTTEAYTDLTLRRGWSAADWKRWLNDLLRSQLLKEGST